MMFYIVHEMNEGKAKLNEIKDEKMFISKMRLFIIGGMFESLDHILRGRTDFRETKKLLEIAGFEEEVLHRCPGKLAFLAIKWYKIACELMGIEQQMIEDISGRTFDIRELPIYQTTAILFKNLKNYEKIDETKESLQSFAKDLGIM